MQLRNPVVFTPACAAALAQAGAVHCHNAWGEMPSVLAQAKALPPVARRPLVVRWLFPPGDSYAARVSGWRPSTAPFWRTRRGVRPSRVSWRMPYGMV